MFDLLWQQPQVDSERPDSHGSELIRGGGGSGGQPPPDRAPPDRRLTNASPKERAPLRKDEKRLYKQKSQESLGKASGQAAAAAAAGLLFTTKAQIEKKSPPPSILLWGPNLTNGIQMSAQKSLQLQNAIVVGNKRSVSSKNFSMVKWCKLMM